MITAADITRIASSAQALMPEAGTIHVRTCFIRATKRLPTRIGVKVSVQLGTETTDIIADDHDDAIIQLRGWLYQIGHVPAML